MCSKCSTASLWPWREIHLELGCKCLCSNMSLHQVLFSDCACTVAREDNLDLPELPKWRNLWWVRDVSSALSKGSKKSILHARSRPIKLIIIGARRQTVGWSRSSDFTHALPELCPATACARALMIYGGWKLHSPAPACLWKGVGQSRRPASPPSSHLETKQGQNSLGLYVIVQDTWQLVCMRN